jgi:hypothetical protein
MKLRSYSTSPGEQGSAVIVIMVLLGLMLLYVGANLKTLHFMSRELKLIEKHQVRRLEAATRPANVRQQIPVAPQTRTNTITASY